MFSSPEMRIDCLKSLLRPIVRFWLRDSNAFKEFVEALKQVFVEVAEEQLKADGHKVNVSRITVATGLYRADVRRIHVEDRKKQTNVSGILTRVIGHWEQDKRFLSKSGAPRVLSEGEFHELVAAVTTTINPATVLFQLERIGAVGKTSKGIKRIESTTYFDKDPREGFALIAKNVETQLFAAIENLLKRHEVKNVHLRTDFDNIALDEIPQIRRWLIKQGNDFHRKARNYLAKYDLDVNPRVGKKGGAEVTIASFSITGLGEKADEQPEN